VQRFTAVVCASSKRNARRSNLTHKCVKLILYFVYLNDVILDSVFHVRWFFFNILFLYSSTHDVAFSPVPSPFDF